MFKYFSLHLYLLRLIMYQPSSALPEFRPSCVGMYSVFVTTLWLVSGLCFHTPPLPTQKCVLE